MSEENVEVVERILGAWQRDDFDGWLSGIDPTIEWHAVLQRLVEGPESVYRGHEGMRGLWRAYRNDVAGFEIEAQELRGVGDDRAVLLARIWWRGPASGVNVESPIGLVMTLRNGRVIRSFDYLSHQEALEAVGLVE